jgi:endoglucanase
MKKWMYNSRSEDGLKQLLDTISPSSYELKATKIVRDRFSSFCDKVDTDVLGNVCGIINPDASFKIGLVAHVDEIGLQITSILPNGMLRFRKIGGIKATSLVNQEIGILSAGGVVNGIIACDPLKDNETESGYTIKTDDLWIDIGTETEKESMELVNIGNYAGFLPSYLKLGSHRIVSKGVDNKVGVFIMLEIMRLLKQHGVSMGIYGMATVQEEIQLRGIKSIGAAINPDIAFVIDVDYATDIPTDKEDKIGKLMLGKGIGLNINADNNIVLQRITKSIASKNALNYQETLGRNISGGTDASALQLQSKGIACVNINIPTRYMHTKIEVCDGRDIETAVNLLFETIKHIEENKLTLFRPGID